jgi:hypothetical protein
MAFGSPETISESQKRQNLKENAVFSLEAG